MRKINWEGVWEFIMKSVAIVVGSVIVYTACRIGYAIIESIYVVLIK